MQTDPERKNRCDILDLLEESAVFGIMVQVRTSDGREFVDRVVEVPSDRDGDWAQFAENGRIAVDQIEMARRPAAV